jgi:hypothetical protein
VVESGALLKRCTSKGYRGFESLPHRWFHTQFALIQRFTSVRLNFSKAKLGELLRTIQNERTRFFD